MNELVLTHARSRLVRGRLQDRALCRFFAPLPPTLIEHEDLTATLSYEENRNRLAQIRQMLAK